MYFINKHITVVQKDNTDSRNYLLRQSMAIVLCSSRMNFQLFSANFQATPTDNPSTTLGLQNNFESAIYTWASGEITFHLPINGDSNFFVALDMSYSKRTTFSNTKEPNSNLILCEEITG